jgi:predicted ATPase
VITSLRIQNFKAFRDQSFGLSRLNLLAGLNGSGKSSLLQSLLVLRQSFDQGLLQQGRVALNGNLVRLGRFQEALFESADEKRISVELGLDSGAGYVCTLSDWQSEDRTGPVETGGTAIDENIALFRPGFGYLAAERIGPRTQYGVPDNEALSSGVGTFGEWTPFYLAKYGDRPAPNPGSYHPGARSAELKHQIEAWMNEVSPGLQVHYERPDVMDVVQLSYSFIARRDTSSRYRPTNVGFGVSYTLPVVTSLVSAQPGDLLLLESPEAHLHPRGQAKLGELLSRAANSGVQVIVESHSDHVMNGIRVAAHQDHLRAEEVRFYYFSWNADDKTGATQVEPILMNQDGRIDHWPNGFFDELDHSLDILLTPKME